MSRHTPGPWERSGNCIYASGRGRIATIPAPKDGGTFDCEQNANLILAAPDLIASLREFMDMWNSGDSTKTSKRAQARRAAMWDAAEVAIAKAEGRT